MIIPLDKSGSISNNLSEEQKSKILKQVNEMVRRSDEETTEYQTLKKIAKLGRDLLGTESQTERFDVLHQRFNPFSFYSVKLSDNMKVWKDIQSHEVDKIVILKGKYSHSYFKKKQSGQ